MSSVASTTVYYTVNIPLDVGSISGNFSVVYDNDVRVINGFTTSGSTPNSVNLTTPFGNFTDVSSCEIVGYGGSVFLFSVFDGLLITDITYQDLVFSDDSVILRDATAEDSTDIYTYTSGGTVSSTLIAPSCFTPGTLISTPTGCTPVQDLAIGDLILNNVGQSVPVKWIGTQRLHPAFARDHFPVCIRAGALGHDLPLRDLYVSPCHALYIDHCLLVQAKALVNGISITQMTQWKGDLLYLHIETEHHEIILAEGAPTETFMDNISRANFNNYSEYQTLYPEAHEMIELDLPRVCHQRQLPNVVKNTLEEIAEGLMGQEKVQMNA
jgi:hypothetical protein